MDLLTGFIFYLMAWKLIALASRLFGCLHSQFCICCDCHTAVCQNRHYYVNCGNHMRFSVLLNSSFKSLQVLMPNFAAYDFKVVPNKNAFSCQ